MHIKSSGVHFDARTTKVWTDRVAMFEFDKGNGASTGASYDPQIHELTMNADVILNWWGAGPVERQMTIESGHLLYRELASEILLTPNARMTRGSFSLDTADAVVKLKKGALDQVEAAKASGTDKAPKRTIDYRAARLFIFFGEGGEVEKIEGHDGARVESASPAGSTVVTANRVDMEFISKDGGSQLTRSLGTGQARVESTPAKRPNGILPPVRVLSSEVIEVKMRPGGEEISEVATHSAAEVEFLPRRAGDKKRKLNGNRLTIYYAAGNMVEKVRAVDVVTRTENPKKDGKISVATTRSKDLQAEFDPATGQTTKIEQWPDFEYEEATLRARASKATLDAAKETITLDGSGRLWDETGSTSADLDRAATGHRRHVGHRTRGLDQDAGWEGEVVRRDVGCAATDSGPRSKDGDDEQESDDSL